MPWSNKELTIEYGTFRDKLLPGQQEEWVVKIKGPKGDKVAAEMVAGMYDASLDAFAANSWGLNVWPSSWSNVRYSSAGFQQVQADQLAYQQTNNPSGDYRQYRGLNWFNWGMYDYGNVYGGRMYKAAARSRDMDDGAKMMMDSAPAPIMAEELAISKAGNDVDEQSTDQESAGPGNVKPTKLSLIHISEPTRPY